MAPCFVDPAVDMQSCGNGTAQRSLLDRGMA
jgi:hypothetical protein